MLRRRDTRRRAPRPCVNSDADIHLFGQDPCPPAPAGCARSSNPTSKQLCRVLSLLAQGASAEEILDDYPKLEQDDIRACIAYAHAVIAGDTLAAVSVERR